VDGTPSYDATWLIANGWSTSNPGVSYSKSGSYGTATLTVATGVVSYALDDNRSATEALKPADTVSDSFVAVTPPWR
jgi:VCBS repeat-containing protein